VTNEPAIDRKGHRQGQPPIEPPIEPSVEPSVEPPVEPSVEPSVEPVPHTRVRRRGVGPFSLRQVTIAILVVMGTAIGLTLATVPISSLAPGLPVPEPSAYLLGSPIPGLRVGDLAPELAIDRADGRLELTDLDGNPVRLADLRGKAVWINFWASWCPPCQFETPVIRTIDEAYRRRGLVIVAIQVQQTVEVGREYAARYELEYRIGADVTGDFFHLYRGFALPTQFFLDPEGRIRQIVNGPLSDARAREILEPLLPIAATPSPVTSPSPVALPTPSPTLGPALPSGFPTSPHPENTPG
jgi:cytochrome c biogenesis protein CcmG/thiol:disulfide interchange protein DsbE